MIALCGRSQKLVGIKFLTRLDEFLTLQSWILNSEWGQCHPSKELCDWPTRAHATTAYWHIVQPRGSSPFGRPPGAFRSDFSGLMDKFPSRGVCCCIIRARPYRVTRFRYSRCRQLPSTSEDKTDAHGILFPARQQNL